MTQDWLNVRIWPVVIDVFDLFWHSVPLVVLGPKVGRMIGRKREGGWNSSALTPRPILDSIRIRPWNPAVPGERKCGLSCW